MSGSPSAGYDIGLSASTGSAANPIAQFGNVYGGGSLGKDWWKFAAIGAGVILLGWLLWKTLK